MLFRQITHDDLGCASYLIGDEHAGVAAVVDPRLDIGEYLRLARFLGVAIEHVLETHTHADHVSGHGRLAAATGARIHVHRDAGAQFDHEPFEDGWELALGEVRVRALHTPGHRPEHCAFALTDTSRGPEPWAVLTGDSLFVGDVARPDLAVDKEEGARGVFRSLRELLALPDHVEVWPGHLGGSMCGGPGMDLKTASTIGYERGHNALLGERDEDAFVERATAALGPQPPNNRAIVAVNRGPLRPVAVESHPLTARQVEHHRAAGALLVDVRSDEQFDDAHVPGSVAVTVLRAGFGTRLAWVARPEQDVVLIGRHDADAAHAAQLAAAVGVVRIAGHLAGGMTTWREERRPTQRVRRMTVEDLHAAWEGPDRPQVIDVRERAEWESGTLPGALRVPYHDLCALPEGLDPERPVAAICASGQRATMAASLLQRHGARDVVHVVDGGVPAWKRRGWPVE